MEPLRHSFVQDTQRIFLKKSTANLTKEIRILTKQTHMEISTTTENKPASFRDPFVALLFQKKCDYGTSICVLACLQCGVAEQIQ